MKRFFIMISIFCVTLAAGVEAKKLDPMEYAPMYGRIGTKRTNKIFNRIDEIGEGYITLDQYTNQKLTRGERREMRREIKEGMYRSPAEEFKLMDKDKDGKVTYEEMRDFQIYKTQLRYGG